MQNKVYNENLTDLLERAKHGDEFAKTQIVEENIGLVHSIIRRFLGRGIENDDLFQLGCMGLVKAIQKFDPGFNVKFSTYAVPMILGEIKRFIRDDGIIKVSRGLKELGSKALAVREKILAETNREPSINELAQMLGESAEEIAIALDAGIKPESINAKLSDSEKDGKTLGDVIESKQNCEKEVIDKILIKDLLSEFGDREQKIIILRYFKEKTQSQIAETLGISQVQVSRLEKKILTEMKKRLSG